MFGVEERDRVRARLLELAKADPAVTAAAVTGSYATGGGDRWSDIDLAFAVDGPLGAALERWTQRLYGELAALHHWDLAAGTAVYRVFLLPGCLEVDLAFAPAADFGPRGPQWRAVFGPPVPPAGSPSASRAGAQPAHQPAAGPGPDQLAGLAWHHALHARTCIERGRWWQAEYWISGVRDQVLALACLRLGHPASYAKGAHLLPESLLGPLEAALVRSLAEAELRRALREATAGLAAELEWTDPALAARLRPVLAEVGGGTR